MFRRSRARRNGRARLPRLMKIEDTHEGSRATGIAVENRRRPFLCLHHHQWRWQFVLLGWRDHWRERWCSNFPSVCAIEFPPALRILLRPAPSDSKVCAPRAQPRPPREMLYVMPLLSLRGLAHVAWLPGCLWLAPYLHLHIAPGSWSLALQRQRAAPRGEVMRGHLGSPPCYCSCACCAMASHGAHASLRHALRCLQKR